MIRRDFLKSALLAAGVPSAVMAGKTLGSPGAKEARLQANQVARPLEYSRGELVIEMFDCPEFLYEAAGTYQPVIFSMEFADGCETFTGTVAGVSTVYEARGFIRHRMTIALSEVKRYDGDNASCRHANPCIEINGRKRRMHKVSSVERRFNRGERRPSHWEGIDV